MLCWVCTYSFYLIKPMLQILHAIGRGRDNGDAIEVDLVFVNINEEDIFPKDKFDILAREHTS